LIHAITVCPHGVYRVIPEMPNVVETSNNLAMLKTEDNCVTIHCLTRSSVESRKEELQEIIHSTFAMAGAEVEFTCSYPGWQPNFNRHILDVMKTTYNTLYNVEPSVIVIHAGLECGIIGRNYPGMEMVSFGPTIEHPHSPDERVNIASVAKFYEFLLATLKAL
jgi:dipeptidase D